MKVSKININHSNTFIIYQNNTHFFTILYWKNPAVFVLLSQKMKIIVYDDEKYTFHYKNH